MDMPPLIIFDLDGTLALSKQPLTEEMAGALARLIFRTKAAIISGGALPQFLTQVVARLPQSANFTNLYLLPTSGGALYEHRAGAWKEVYEETISPSDADLIVSAMEQGAAASGVIDPAEKAYGERIERRGAQISFSALGQEAPVEQKLAWDPDMQKRKALLSAIATRLPAGYIASLGGSTTIDVVREGIDKAYGIRRLAEHLSLPLESILFVGDKLMEGGNDFPATTTGAAYRAVADPNETLALIRALLDR